MCVGRYFSFSIIALEYRMQLKTFDITVGSFKHIKIHQEYKANKRANSTVKC